MVLMVSMIVTVIGLSAITVTRIQRRSFEGTHDASIARDYAQSAIDIAMLKIKQDANWRTTYTHDTWVADQTIGRGTFRWKLVDQVDTDLNNDSTHPARLVAWGMCGNTTQKVSVYLEPFGSALTCLEVSLHANSNILFTNGTLTSSQIISANNTVDAAGGTAVTSDVEAVTVITGAGTYTGTQTTGITPRTMPASTVFDYYIANGTRINIADILLNGSFRQIKKIVLSPATNPYGAGQTNPQGIYVIDCMGVDIQLMDSRIVGTLVLLNTGLNSKVVNSVNWEPAVANYPLLLVQGNMGFEFTASAVLDETSPPATNFNPPGTPYNGVEDSDTVDTYPSMINGLVYVSGNVTSANDPAFDGVVVAGGAITVTGGTFTLTYQSTFFTNPPPGFTAGNDVRIVPGSWKQEVD